MISLFLIDDDNDNNIQHKYLHIHKKYKNTLIRNKLIVIAYFK